MISGLLNILFFRFQSEAEKIFRIGCRAISHVSNLTRTIEAVVFKEGVGPSEACVRPELDLPEAVLTRPVHCPIH